MTHRGPFQPLLFCDSEARFNTAGASDHTSLPHPPKQARPSCEGFSRRRSRVPQELAPRTPARRQRRRGHSTPPRPERRQKQRHQTWNHFNHHRHHGECNGCISI